MKKLLFSIIPMIGCALGACSSDSPDNPDKPDKPFVVCPGSEQEPFGSLDNVTRATVNATNEFAFNLLKAAAKTSDDNVCLSPISVSSVLAMLANGDDGETRDEVLALLGYRNGEEGVAELNDFYRTVISNLPIADPKTTCKFTNSLWYNPERISISHLFANKVNEAFYAFVLPENPGDEKGMKLINDFVADNTNGLILNFLEEPADVPAAFINTTYFKGIWTTQFDKKMTYPNSFLNIDGSVTKTEYMFSENEMEYARTQDGTQGVRIPYGNGSFYMTAVLPSDRINHVPLLECLDNDNWRQLEESFFLKEIALSMPKFAHESKCEILPVLQAMGLDKACDFDHGFNSIISSPDVPLALEFFKHSAKIIVDEEGTEAAGASMAGMETSAAPFSVTFNRPFVYLIQEKKTGAILFMGAVTKFP